MLLSPQKGMKCCKINPFEVSPHMKNVNAKIQNAGCLNPMKRFWKLKVTGFSLGKGGGFLNNGIT